MLNSSNNLQTYNIHSYTATDSARRNRILLSKSFNTRQSVHQFTSSPSHQRCSKYTQEPGRKLTRRCDNRTPVYNVGTIPFYASRPNRPFQYPPSAALCETLFQRDVTRTLSGPSPTSYRPETAGRHLFRSLAF